jgi:hypothetical protein
MLDKEPTSYRAWAEAYYECPVPLAAVREVYAHKPLTAQLIKRINPAVKLKELAADIEEIGYP